ncbi:MAG: phasin family protein [Brevundimonas sp.]|jgi:phasin family protein|uniref:phasin family protein n=1 Tax=Brevundimonas sp. TaxID=1871086 RepID=UPI0022CBB544|nr:TIGR01841 family phasin [Brevundimonas sp.]MCZ8087345.1 TIGR01841 family phasin [Brevundimonas sp.]MCZ8193931.1 TIGR01841 family phasin [Brevundimonas sp.]
MADSAETVKKTVEQATTAAKATAEKAQAAGAQAFRETIDRSVAGLTEISSHGKKNLEAMVESATAAQRGAEALSQQAMAYSKKTLEQNLSAAQSLASARSVQELVELQTTFARSAIETYLSEVTKMTDTLTASMKDSFKPINERVTASVERFQAAR